MISMVGYLIIWSSQQDVFAGVISNLSAHSCQVFPSLVCQLPVNFRSNNEAYSTQFAITSKSVYCSYSRPHKDHMYFFWFTQLFKSILRQLTCIVNPKYAILCKYSCLIVVFAQNKVILSLLKLNSANISEEQQHQKFLSHGREDTGKDNFKS